MWRRPTAVPQVSVSVARRGRTALSRQPNAAAPEADAIVAYSIDQAGGKLTLLGYATAGIEYPRNFALAPTATWLYAATQQGDTIVQFRIDRATGQLAATSQVTQTPTPVCIVFKSVAAAPMPGLPSTGVGHGTGGDGTLGVLGAAGLGAAARMAPARRRAALAAEGAGAGDDDPR